MGGQGPHQGQAVIAPYLMSGERVLWTGAPDPGVVFAPGDALMVPFSVMWAGFAVTWETGVIRSGAPVFLALWGIPFVLVGAYVTVGRFVAKRRIRRRTTYVLTDRRALVISGRSMRSAPVVPGPSWVRTSRDGRHGSYSFGSPPALGGWFVGVGGQPPGRGVTDVTFEDITDLDGLQSALRHATAR